MEIITGRTGKPHVTSQQDREINQAIFGTENYVLNVGSCFAYEEMGSNRIRIKDGILMLQGTAASIANGLYDEVVIENGTQGKERTDLICAFYERDIDNDGMESVRLEVLKDMNMAIFEVASIFSKKIRNGATTAYFPLYEVVLSGVSINSITPVFKFANEQKVLWSGDDLMGANKEIKLKEAVSKQKTGIELIWTPTDKAGENIHHQCILKNSVILNPDTTHSTFLCNTNFTKVACKSVYIFDDVIKGNQYNTVKGQQNGIVFNNADYTLRYVLGY